MLAQTFPSMSQSERHWDGLERAQDYSSSEDGGVARHYGLLNGWSASYPETTG